MRSLPWARPRHERLLLALVAAVALSQLIPVSAQDVSRICLGQAILHGRVSNDACFLQSVDQARYGAHIYSDKAPGLSLLELPAVALFNPGAPQGWTAGDLDLWAVRILSVGLCLLVCTFLVGRVSEGLAPGYGGIALVTFALGTLVGPLASASFEHVPAATAAFGAFLLAWRRRPGLAGLVAGAAVLLEYECGVVVVAVGLYVALHGRRGLLRYLAGLVPAGLVLGSYDWAAFGAPWHLSYSYLSNFYASEQSQGLFGIGVPHLEGVVEVFAGQDGLLVFSPVLILAALGLVRLARDHLAEAVVAAVIAAVYIVANCGYFEPYGGQSPGPRFLAVSLPFLALGLASAYSSTPRLTLVLAAFSVFPTVASIVSWGGGAQMSGTLWVQLAHIPSQLGSSLFVRSLNANVLSQLGIGTEGAAAIVGMLAAVAFVVAARGMPWPQIRAQRARPRRRPALRAVVLVTACAYLLAASDVLALTNEPYGDDPQPVLDPLETTISAPSHDTYEGGEVNFTVSVLDTGPMDAPGVLLYLKLSPGMRLVGRPARTLGSGCSGSSSLVCNIGALFARSAQTATVYLGVQMTQLANQTLTAYSSAQGDPRSNVASFTLKVGR